MRRALAITAVFAAASGWSPPASGDLLRVGPVRVRGLEANAGVLSNDNILGSSPAEIDAFRSHDRSAFFVVKDLEDRAIEGRVAVELSTPSFPTAPLQWKLAAEGARYLESPIRSGAHYSADLRQRLSGRFTFLAGADHAPSTYARHRRDKDAPSGAPAFRAEAYRQTGYSASLYFAVTARFSPFLEASYEEKDYRHAFDERDQWRRGAGGGLAVRLSQMVSFELGYERARATSRNSIALTGDLSYRENAFAAKARSPLPASLSLWLSLKEKYREYTSADPADVNHYKRHDRTGYLELRLTRALSGPIGTYASYERSDRSAHSKAGSNLQDEGSYKTNIVAAGLTLTLR